MTLTPDAKRVAVEVSLPCRGLDANSQPSPCKANILTNCAITAVFTSLKVTIKVHTCKGYVVLRFKNLKAYHYNSYRNA